MGSYKVIFVSRFLSILTLALVAIGLLGCGGQGKSGGGQSAPKPLTNAEYGAKLKAYAQEFQSSVQTSRAKIQGASGPAGKAAGLGEFRTEFEKLATQLDGLEPPAVAKTAHDSLVGTLRKGGADIGVVQDAVRTSDRTKAQTGLQALQADNTQIQSALTDLQAKVK